jgi:hypothetical protein
MSESPASNSLVSFDEYGSFELMGPELLQVAGADSLNIVPSSIYAGPVAVYGASVTLNYNWQSGPGGLSYPEPRNAHCSGGPGDRFVWLGGGGMHGVAVGGDFIVRVDNGACGTNIGCGAPPVPTGITVLCNAFGP